MPWNAQMVRFITTWMEIQPHHRLTWMEIQPVGWKSNQQQNSEKLKVLDFGHATSMLRRKALKYTLVLYG